MSKQLRLMAICVATVTTLLLVAGDVSAQEGVTARYATLEPAIATRLALAQYGVPMQREALAASVKTSSSSWQVAVDQYWGSGAPTANKLQIFDGFWNDVDQRFAAFQGLQVDWTALRNQYRAEVAGGVSRGRFAAIMSQLSVALRESHTQATDVVVNFETLPAPGVPLFWQGGLIFDFSGACVTALDDGSALVYSVVPNHPLGLQPGDRVLGYEGRLWTDIYPELIDGRLPISPLWWGSSPSSFVHSFVASVTNNSHLFSSIDIVKHGSGVVQHLSTAPLQGQASPLCTEQMDQPGIAKPDFFAGESVTWGMLDGTRIGYIYGYAWEGDAGTQFFNAIQALTANNLTDGLIIDFRFNIGGNMFLSNPGLSLLFPHPVPTIGFATRADPSDHFKMRSSTPPAVYVIPSTKGSGGYSKRIAVLTGPGAISSGDQVALRMTYLPNARTFGKSTSTAFNAPGFLDLDPDWYVRVAHADAYRINSPNNYLTHDEFVVDEPIWLQPDDVAAGEDSVVKAAVAWILH